MGAPARWRGGSRARRARTALVLVLVAAAAGATAPGVGGRPATRIPGTPAPHRALELGVTTNALAFNSSRRWTVANLAGLRSFERAAGRRADVVVWFADWAHVANFSVRQARAIRRHGAIPEVTWEPWNSWLGPRHPQPRYRLRTIITGRHDAYIRRWAREIAAYGGPLRIRFAHEMNARAYPWSERTNGNRRGEYARAWRHVTAIFRREGADNVAWEWSPVVGRIPRELFPGTRDVDLVALTGLNGGASLFNRHWDSFQSDFGRWIGVVHNLAPRLPMVISEVACTEFGGSKAKWIAAMFRYLRSKPYVRGITWFNVRKETDWRITSSPSARRAFARGLRGG